MTSDARRVRLKAYAKLNLNLKVLNRRPDGYHEIRTIFQTISLADVLDLEFVPKVKSEILLKGSSDIPDNLVVRAANLLTERLKIRGRVVFRLWKKTPMGAGLGGGSSDAAAVLLALPVLAGKTATATDLAEWAAEIGSDVPFFLLGGAALGCGRGEELYPIPDSGGQHGLLVIPGIHLSTSDAYAAMARTSTYVPPLSERNRFQMSAWSLAGVSDESDWRDLAGNDFEEVAFQAHPTLRSLKRRLRELGARPAMMTGSGSALFGLFASRTDLEAARRAFSSVSTIPFTFLNRARYRALWRKQLEGHVEGDSWPPRSAHT